MSKALVVCFAVTLAAGLSAPALAKEATKINRPANVEIVSSMGDNMVRVQLTESLPNAFGGADIFGRKRNRGMVFLTYFGIRDGKAVIRRRTVDIMSDEATMSRGGLSTFNGTANEYDGQTTVSGTTIRAPQANVIALPADTIEVYIDAVKGGLLTVEDRIVEVLAADENTIRFKVRSNPTK